MNPGTIATAAYQDSPVAEYRGNPLIEALPPIFTEREAAQAIARYPEEPVGAQTMDGSIRLHCIDRMRSVIQPLPIHLELEAAVSLVLRGGYVGRNPMQPATVRHLHGLSTGKQVTEGFTSTATTFSLVGLAALVNRRHWKPSCVFTRKPLFTGATKAGSLCRPKLSG